MLTCTSVAGVADGSLEGTGVAVCVGAAVSTGVVGAEGAGNIFLKRSSNCFKNCFISAFICSIGLAAVGEGSGVMIGVAVVTSFVGSSISVGVAFSADVGERSGHHPPGGTGGRHRGLAFRHAGAGVQVRAGASDNGLAETHGPPARQPKVGCNGLDGSV